MFVCVFTTDVNGGCCCCCCQVKMLVFYNGVETTNSAFVGEGIEMYGK